MEKELLNLEEKEEDQSAKTPDPTIKINKVEEAIVKSFQFYSTSILLSTIKTKFIAKIQKGELVVLFKPPTA